MREKVCRRCQVAKPAAEFRVDQRYRDGLSSWCCQCHRERNSTWAKENRERLSAKSQAWRDANLAKAREANTRHKRSNRETLYVKHVEWVKNNRGKRRATYAARKGAKLQATPKWADRAAMAAIYRRAAAMEQETGTRMHVDHIVPLQHPLVCGLHCEANLQILPGAENEAKRNLWWPDMHEAAYRQPRLFAEPTPRPEQMGLLA